MTWSIYYIWRAIFISVFNYTAFFWFLSTDAQQKIHFFFFRLFRDVLLILLFLCWPWWWPETGRWHSDGSPKGLKIDISILINTKSDQSHSYDSHNIASDAGGRRSHTSPLLLYFVFVFVVILFFLRKPVFATQHRWTFSETHRRYIVAALRFGKDNK